MQTFFDNAMTAARQKELQDSPQLLLWELILKLEQVTNKELPLYIDLMDKRPKGVNSWRGRYAELSIQSEDFWSYNTDELDSRYGGVYETYITKNIWKENPTVGEWIEVLKEAVGKTFTWYKWGDYLMSKNTPIWFAEYGDSWMTIWEEYLNVFFIDVLEKEDRVYLVTQTEKE